MSDSTFTDEQITAVQGVVDRVNSYQESAPEGTVEANLREGLTEVGVELGDDQVRSLTDAIEKGGSVDAAQVLG
ncbi:hypothetical protein I601_3270 [Nocardioides dokdonensis FR1436]|uniref:Uncharacterized protein n=1 Tax=Nocardioides dokdonensis FR1436 TaxID=1300347 RepID=A0A1A9GMY1_9ACTN|nr:hypothetical protein [Nocardioides dokdonensis]ANH39677.1 hypothetical protein I601_3270 [Nocardioides dokdonensis FR1436]